MSKPVPDPLEDIKREAEKTRERIADMEKVKEREARRLDETAGDRERSAALNRRLRPRFRAGQVPPDQVARMLRRRANSSNGR